MTDYRLEEMCMHGEATPADCPTCLGTVRPREISQMVFASSYGVDYHFDRNCHRLVMGQQMVEHRGGTPSPIEAVPEDSVKYDKSPCSYCRAKKTKK
jgi:hypothetical protein